jgi:hypothetical protein
MIKTFRKKLLVTNDMKSKNKIIATMTQKANMITCFDNLYFKLIIN